MDKKFILGITLGDLNGIGCEVIIKTFLDNRILEFCTPVIYGSAKVLSHHRKALNLQAFNFNQVKAGEKLQSNTVNILNVWEEDFNVQFGVNSEQSGRYAFLSLQAAVQDLKNGLVDGIVTAPVNKRNIRSTDFPFNGQTEYLASQAGADAIMMLVNENLRVGVVTNHVPVQEVSALIKKELIMKKILMMRNSLVKDFGCDRPKIAVLGLNPHSGDSGLIGNEELKEIIPAIQDAKSRNILCFGPYSADGFFGSGHQYKFDGVLAMYHDQGLIPFKTLSFGNGVNFTAGLPFVRTSPDHGTGFDIAGQGIANEESFRQAVFTAVDILKYRTVHSENNLNPVEKNVKV